MYTCGESLTGGCLCLLHRCGLRDEHWLSLCLQRVPLSGGIHCWMRWKEPSTLGSWCWCGRTWVLPCVCVCVSACVLRGWGPEGQTCSINCALPGLWLWGPCRTQAAHRLPLSPEDDCSADPRSPPSPVQLLSCCGHRLDKEMGETVERMLLIRRSKCKRRRLEACLLEAVLIWDSRRGLMRTPHWTCGTDHQSSTQVHHGLPGRLLAITTRNYPANSETPQGRKGQDSRGTCPGFSDEDGAALWAEPHPCAQPCFRTHHPGRDVRNRGRALKSCSEEGELIFEKRFFLSIKKVHTSGKSLFKYISLRHLQSICEQRLFRAGNKEISCRCCSELPWPRPPRPGPPSKGVGEAGEGEAQAALGCASLPPVLVCWAQIHVANRPFSPRTPRCTLRALNSIHSGHQEAGHCPGDQVHWSMDPKPALPTGSILLRKRAGRADVLGVTWVDSYISDDSVTSPSKPQPNKSHSQQKL